MQLNIFLGLKMKKDDKFSNILMGFSVIAGLASISLFSAALITRYGTHMQKDSNFLFLGLIVVAVASIMLAVLSHCFEKERSYNRAYFCRIATIGGLLLSGVCFSVALSEVHKDTQLSGCMFAGFAILLVAAFFMNVLEKMSFKDFGNVKIDTSEENIKNLEKCEGLTFLEAFIKTPPISFFYEVVEEQNTTVSYSSLIRNNN
jgi:MFS family permease